MGAAIRWVFYPCVLFKPRNRKVTAKKCQVVRRVCPFFILFLIRFVIFFFPVNFCLSIVFVPSMFEAIYCLTNSTGSLFQASTILSVKQYFIRLPALCSIVQSSPESPLLQSTSSLCATIYLLGYMCRLTPKPGGVHR